MGCRMIPRQEIETGRNSGVQDMVLSRRIDTSWNFKQKKEKGVMHTDGAG